MSVSEMFLGFIDNLAIRNTDQISLRYGELTRALNRQFRETESQTANTLQVGSFGRKTGIDGISDLDMLYIMPKTSWETYNINGGQSKLLHEAKSAILNRYPKTEVRVDRLVVTVTYANFHVEVQPVFEQDDCTYRYPDTKGDGAWRVTKPRQEMQAIADNDRAKNQNLRRLCKMARAWRNKHGVGIGGLLIDTLAYKFLNSTSDYDNVSFNCYDKLSRDFFQYLSNLPQQEEYAAPGSGQRVKVHNRFQHRAKEAYELCVDAIAAENQIGVNQKWKKVFGRPFPSTIEKSATETFSRALPSTVENTEQFIEDMFSVDIRSQLKIECAVTQDGFRTTSLQEMRRRNLPLKPKKDLKFRVSNVSQFRAPFEIYWKVLNKGVEAELRNCVRGQIERDNGRFTKTEITEFAGNHFVECYLVQHNVVVARDKILVPISTSGDTL